MYVFCCNCDKSVDLFKPLADRIGKEAKWAVVPGVAELAEFRLGATIGKDDYVPEIYQYLRDNCKQVQGVVLTNDWCLEARMLIAFCRWRSITTFVLQESIIGLNTAHRRLLNADVAFLQGRVSLQQIESHTEQVFLTGHTIYNKTYLNFDQSKCNRILINVNFTSDDDVCLAKAWLNDVVSQLNGFKFELMVHPRCELDLHCYGVEIIKSSSSRVSSILAGGGLIISRESSLIHEAIFNGLKVVMYRGDFTPMDYDFGAHPNLLELAESRSDIRKKLMDLLNEKIVPESAIVYLSDHYEFATDTDAMIHTLLSGTYKKRKQILSDILGMSRLMFHVLKRTLKIWL